MGETYEDTVENYNAWIDLALQHAERDEWDQVKEMIDETSFKSSYLFCLIEAHRDLLQRHDQREHIYQSKLLVQGQALEREKQKVRDLLKGADDLPTAEGP